MIKNYIYNALFQILRIVLPVITMPYVARVLSADGVGAYSLSAAWANFFMILGMLGIDTYGSRQIAYSRHNLDKLKKTFWEINLLKSITTTISIIIYSIIIFIFVRPENSILYYIQIINLFSCTLDVSWYFSGIENFKSTSLRNIVVKIVCTIAIFAFVTNENDVWLYTFILCIGQCIGQAVLWRDIYKALFPIYIPPISTLRLHINKTIMLWIPSLAASMYNYLDKVMLGMFTNEFQVGIYEYSQTIVKVPATLIFAIATVTMPHVAADYANQKNENTKNIFNKSMHTVTMLALPMCFGFMAISDNFVTWFLGSGYSEVGQLLKISAWVILPISWSQIVGSQQIIAKGREKVYSISICGGAVINILLNFLFVEQYQARGVLISSIIAEIFVLIIMIIFTIKDFDFLKAFSGTIKYFVLSFIMYKIILFISSFLYIDKIAITVIQIVIGMISYLIMLFVVKDEGVLFVYERIRCKLLKRK